MTEIDINDLKKIEINILKEIDGFCGKNNLRYFLCGGSLLGAVRHKGFIPWDDDIDILMPREDYERFIETFGDKTYSILSYKNNRDYYLPFAKVVDTRTCIRETLVKSVSGCGVYIDVFPLDGLSNNLLTAEKILKKNNRKMRLNFAIELNVFNKNIFKYCICKILRIFFNSKKLCKSMEKTSMRYKVEDSNYVGVSFGFYGKKEIMDKEIFENSIQVEFEDGKYFAPSEYDKYLSHLYGNYMQLPPIEKQVTHHSFIAYWR